MNTITADARIRIVCRSNKSLHLATGVALEKTTLAGPEEYEEHAWFVVLDTPTLDGVEFVAVAEEHLVLLGEGLFGDLGKMNSLLQVVSNDIVIDKNDNWNVLDFAASASNLTGGWDVEDED